MAKGKKRKPDLRRIRTSKTYTLIEIAKTLDRHIATVRVWVRNGLPLLSDQLPILVLGSELKNWLQKTRSAKACICQPDEMYCFKCREPRKPKPETVTIIPRNEKTVSIKGQCEICDTRMNRAGSFTKLDQINDCFRSLTPHKQHLSVCNNPSVNHPKSWHHFDEDGGG